MDSAPKKTRIELGKDSALLRAVTHFNHLEGDDSSLKETLNIPSGKNLPLLFGLSEKIRSTMASGCPLLNDCPEITAKDNNKLYLLATALLNIERTKKVEIGAIDILRTANEVIRPFIPFYKAVKDLNFMERNLASREYQRNMQGTMIHTDETGTSSKRMTNVISLDCCTGTSAVEAERQRKIIADFERRLLRTEMAIKENTALIDVLEKIAEQLKPVAHAATPFSGFQQPANDNIKNKRKRV